MPISPSLQEWIASGGIDAIPNDMKYKQVAIDQICFFLDKIATLFVPQDQDLDIRKHFCRIAGWHTSKSVNLPVYSFLTDRGLEVVARDNFHNWNVTIISPRDIEFPDYFGIDNNSEYLFCEGMEEWKRGKHADNKREFSFCVWDRYQLFAIMWYLSMPTNNLEFIKSIRWRIDEIDNDSFLVLRQIVHDSDQYRASAAAE